MRNNSFDLIRHFAALMVLVSHHYVLAGLSEPAIQGYNSLGGIAVLCFFAISGLLITLSYLNTASLQNYLLKRVARIFPALIICSFVMTYVAGAFFASDYVSGAGAFIDFLRISAFGRATIDEVTHDFIFSESFNGSLWTLKIEFAFYILLALVLTLYRSALMPWALLLLFCIATYVLGNYPVHALAQKLLVYCAAGIAFFSGSLIAFYKQHFDRARTKFIVLAVASLMVFVSLGSSAAWVLATLGISLATISLGLLYVDKTIRGRFDISYGIYLYAFPVQQLIINKTQLGFFPSMAVSALIVVGLATLSWLIIEQPALALAHRNTPRKSAPAPQASQVP
ncbi:acyltransferase family protein [Pseudomonas frederiksbergensis]|uniref:Acyltransferase 3 domain-containing protein n=1 Tax=Pseudomonas frederiksbergensis TaxID=104087 RepID=A0A6L5BLX5_9PSED|nr:acyltransferase [Pseudomonas frederiksbergensis]KAF2389681.1 hypothetical protein FX983_04120 [Pseudomonas frederiksbergensis]